MSEVIFGRLRRWMRRRRKERLRKFVEQWGKRWDNPPDNIGLLEKMFSEMVRPRYLYASSGGWAKSELEVRLHDGYVIRCYRSSLRDCYLEAAHEYLERLKEAPHDTKD
jgi:hypothetical protein